MNFHPDLLGYTSLNSGVRCVDATVTSVHKNLGGLSATALINVGKESRISLEQLSDIYGMINTTSPSPYLILDVECCVRKFLEEGEMLVQNSINLNNYLRDELNKIHNVKIADFPGQDPTKTIYKVNGITGGDLYHHLDEHRINVEKYSAQSVLVTVHININQEDIDKLIEATLIIAQKYGQDELQGDAIQAVSQYSINTIPKGLLEQREFKLELRDVLASNIKKIKGAEAIGKISAEIKYKCPPGYPILLYGELIKEDHIKFIGDEEILKVVDDQQD